MGAARATWISWPHHEPDWPGKLGPIPWVYAEIARVLADHERSRSCVTTRTCATPRTRRSKRTASGRERIRLHVVPTDRVWLRDSAPTGVHDAARRRRTARNWAFNAWAKYDNWRSTRRSPRRSRRDRGRRLEQPRRADNGRAHRPRGRRHRVGRPGPAARDRGVAAERRPGPQSRADARRLRSDLSTSSSASARTIWLGEGCVGDDTHGHIDDIARFVSADTIVLAVEADPSDENHERSVDNLRRLELASEEPPWVLFAS